MVRADAPFPAAGSGPSRPVETAEEVVISAVGLVKRFGRVTALDGLELTVRRGHVVGFLGPNGAGKSTTIRILLDLIRPSAGQVRVFGQDPRQAPVGLRRRIGYLPGELRLDDRLSVWQTIRSWSRLRGGDERTLENARSLLERLDLAPDRAARALSSGNRRKLGIVGAFMDEPELLVLDEPTNGLDPLVQQEFHLLVDQATARGGTVFLSSHVLGEVERVADEAVVIRAGRVVAAGTVAELVGQARQPFVAVFRDPPPVAALDALAGVQDLVVTGREVRGSVAGGPEGLLSVLAANPVERLLMPEPDLEQAFLGFYAVPGPDAAAGSVSPDGDEPVGREREGGTA
jgi:ABC-2 type transport system ATP-binding protein